MYFTILKKTLFFVVILFSFISCNNEKNIKKDSSDQLIKLEGLGANKPSNSLPGDWRPFNDESPWNTPIAQNAVVHEKSDRFITKMTQNTDKIRFGNKYLIPIWVVNYDSMSHYTVKGSYPFDIWDMNDDYITETEVPADSTLWGEQTEDGHIIIIDTVYNFSWEMSRFKGLQNDTLRSSTFNVWDLTGTGTGDPNEGKRWKARGGRGSGFPNIAGLIRPEEILSGKIRHALAFTYSQVKKDDFLYPAARSDGKSEIEYAPSEGMLFQLNPNLTESDFDRWELSEGAKVVAVALQEYGMYLCDVGGDFALQIQLLDKDSVKHRRMWDNISPGLYSSIAKIPFDQFRLINTGEPVSGGSMNVVTTPLISPSCGSFQNQTTVTIETHQAWPDAIIRYTLDGSSPTEVSTKYERPFLITESVEIRAIAFDKSGKKSHVMRAPIKIY